ncbi:hypothetical protein [Clostridium nigeriense]|uniref:hypothetical protein n=1 Tax=Clostridium nigeriense TaxID=1805470 RepID=UPI00083375FC|nr:hypothetical protein [Clostridium nigeriense]
MKKKYIKVLRFSLFYSIIIESIFVLLDIINKNFFIKESLISFIIIFVITFLFQIIKVKIKDN